ncbi:uncharacterized protein LTR77_005648 [Saxophila tyrrhenica]|uniref:RING-CH-type domain-containing protein n=1 Tax=Saxophila tyrrhenica TaxID=1690608 RepID=A0AAV9PD85_9PEZI|nr:hypothetical protein LTR77_005648 [Saxophila tyrrhenica]
MASLPPRQASQTRRASPDQPSDAQQQHQPSPSPVRTRSEDSQTLFLNKPGEAAASQPAQDSEQPQNPQASEGEPEEKQCWICFSDSSEDTPETSPWRNPCPCALVAHEACLLDWIADMEAPNNRRHNDSLSAPKIECPQCKTEIKLARPRNLVVDAVRGVERLGGQMVTPAALSILLGTVYHSSMAWGVQSIYAVFGAADGYRILRPLVLNNVRAPIEITRFMTRRQILERVGEALLVHFQHWRLYVGVPLITPILVLSRTSLADTVLPVLPIVFFASQANSMQDTGDFAVWPPSASMAFATLPYIRSAYNYFYRRVLMPKQIQWLKEIQPRLTQEAGNAEGGNGEQGAEGGQQGNMGPREDDDNVFEVRIDGGIWDDWEDEDEVEDAAAARQAVEEAIQQAQPPPQDQPQQGGNDNANAAEQPQQNPDQQQQPPQQAQQQQPQQQEQQPQQPQQQQQQQQPIGERRLSFSPTAIAETVLGALMFPAIAGVSGELLKFWLPSSWTTPKVVRSWSGGRSVAKGLLQEKWGRSLVGGCLFVVFKDAVMLYVRWKMAEMHRKRRVVNWKGPRRGRA